MTYTVRNFLDSLSWGPYSFPGGYPRHFVTRDGSALSFAAAWECRSEIVAALASPGTDPQWEVIGADVNWETPDLTCDHTDLLIEAAYIETPDGAALLDGDAWEAWQQWTGRYKARPGA